jgi:hypothetical protein
MIFLSYESKESLGFVRLKGLAIFFIEIWYPMDSHFEGFWNKENSCTDSFRKGQLPALFTELKHLPRAYFFIFPNTSS